MTNDDKLAAYRHRLDETYDEGADDGPSQLFVDLYTRLEDHGFELIPLEQARAETLELRRMFDARMEYLIDYYVTPRGFWGHKIGIVMPPMVPAPTVDKGK